MKRTEEELDDLVDAWHDGEGAGMSLMDFLGMTKEEYQDFCVPKTKPTVIMFALKSMIEEKWISKGRNIVTDLSQAHMDSHPMFLYSILRAHRDRLDWNDWEVRRYKVEEI